MIRKFINILSVQRKMHLPSKYNNSIGKAIFYSNANVLLGIRAEKSRYVRDSREQKENLPRNEK